MSRLLVTIKGEPESIWQGFTELCKAYGLPYHSLKGKPYPRKHGDIIIYRLPFRKINNHFVDANKKVNINNHE